MLTFQGQYEKCQSLAQDNTTTSTNFFKDSINTGKENVEAELGLIQLSDTATDLTEASVSEYPLPANCVRPNFVYITVGGRRYDLVPTYDEQLWQAIKANYPSDSSDYAQRMMVRRNTIEVYPTPATAGNTITFIFDPSKHDLSYDDYATGTITSIANGAKAVIGSGTTWTSAMAGRVLKITSYPQEFEIASVTDTTHLTLVRDFTGVSIAAATEAYIIGEVMNSPETTHIIPVYFALWQYYLGFKQSVSKARQWKSLYDEAMKKAIETYANQYGSGYIPPQRRERARAMLTNPNAYPSPLT